MRKVLFNLNRLGLTALLLAIAGLSSASAQDKPQTWFDDTSSPTLEKTWEIPGSQFSSSVTQGYKPSCVNSPLLTRSFNPGLPLWSQSIDRCWYPTGPGLMAQNDNYLLAGDGLIAGRVSNIGTYLRPTPRSGTFLEIKTNGSTTSNFVRFHFGTSVDTSSGLFGTVSHKLSTEDSLTLTNSAGNRVMLSVGQGINYSQNGKWATGVTVNYAMFRVNLETKQILNFGEPIKHGGGWNPFMALSITNDGRYAVAAGTATTGGQWMRIYDLENCDGTEQEHVALTHANCSYRDLTGFLKSNIPGFNRFTMAEFGDNDTLVFYHYTAGADRVYTRYIMRAPNAGERARNYIALGDSFASGEGAFNYFRGTDEGSEVNNCHLSKHSYPYLIGEWLKLDSYHSVACSGAVTRNVIGPEKIDRSLTNETRTNQYLEEVENNELGEWFPGFQLQLSFLERFPSEVITISMIGNDIGFDEKVKRCLAPDTCYDTYEDRLEILREIRGKFEVLTGLYDELKATAGPEAKIYVIGYPKIANPSGSCGANVRLDQEELVFAGLLVKEINNVIELASRRAGVVYVSIEDALAGHWFCETTDTPAMNGLTAGNDNYIIGNESYHPTAFGHYLMGQAIMRGSDSFNQPMPAPDSSLTASTTEEGLEFLNRPKSDRTVRNTHSYDGLSLEILYQEQESDITYASTRLPFQPGSQVSVQLHSNPVELATVDADEQGGVAVKVTIPDSIPTGFHTLHLIGKDLAGNEIDIYKVVYVAYSEADKNGDGIVDSQQACGPLEASGQDTDEDGVDDACDAVILREEGALADENSSTEANESEVNVTSTPNTVSSESGGTTTQAARNAATIPEADNEQEVLGTEAAQPAPVIAKEAAVAAAKSLNVTLMIGGVSTVVALTLLWRLRYAKTK